MPVWGNSTDNAVLRMEFIEDVTTNPAINGPKRQNTAAARNRRLFNRNGDILHLVVVKLASATTLLQ